MINSKFSDIYLLKIRTFTNPMNIQEPELPGDDDNQTFCFACNHVIHIHGRFFFCRTADEIICNRCLRISVEVRHCNVCNDDVDDFHTHYRRGRQNAFLARNRRRRREEEAQQAEQDFDMHAPQQPQPIPEPQPQPFNAPAPEIFEPNLEEDDAEEEEDDLVPPDPDQPDHNEPEDFFHDVDDAQLPTFKCKLYSIHEPRNWSDYFYYTLSNMEIAGIRLVTIFGVPEFECDDIIRTRVRLHSAHPFHSENFKSYFHADIRRDLYELLSDLDSMNVSSDTYYSCGIEHLLEQEGTPTEKSYAVLARFQHMLNLRHQARGLGARVGIKMPN
jgi:hypothetical protein